MSSESNPLADLLDQLSHNQTENQEVFNRNAYEFWNNLSYEDKLKAFYVVTNTIYKGDIQSQASYRTVLYDFFGFDLDSYAVGIDSGYIEIHNRLG